MTSGQATVDAPRGEVVNRVFWKEAVLGGSLSNPLSQSPEILFWTSICLSIHFPERMPRKKGQQKKSGGEDQDKRKTGVFSKYKGKRF